MGPGRSGRVGTHGPRWMAGAVVDGPPVPIDGTLKIHRAQWTRVPAGELTFPARPAGVGRALSVWHRPVWGGRRRPDAPSIVIPSAPRISPDRKRVLRLLPSVSTRGYSPPNPGRRIKSHRIYFCKKKGESQPGPLSLTGPSIQPFLPAVPFLLEKTNPSTDINGELRVGGVALPVASLYRTTEGIGRGPFWWKVFLSTGREGYLDP